MKNFSLIAILTSLIFYTPAFSANFAIDKSHSEIAFSIKHMTISNVKGRFNDYKGSFAFDEKTKTIKSASLKINTASIDTRDAKRDADLRSPNFFDVAKYPNIIFTMKNARRNSENKYMVIGDMTIHGITKRVMLDVEFLGAVTDPWGNHRAGFTMRGKINRKDFGLTWNKVLESGGLVVGDEVTLLIEFEGIVAKAKN